MCRGLCQSLSCRLGVLLHLPGWPAHGQLRSMQYVQWKEEEAVTSFMGVCTVSKQVGCAVSGPMAVAVATV